MEGTEIAMGGGDGQKRGDRLGGLAGIQEAHDGGSLNAPGPMSAPPRPCHPLRFRRLRMNPIGFIWLCDLTASCPLCKMVIIKIACL